MKLRTLLHFAGIAWVLTREQQPSISTIDKVYAVLKRNGLDSGKLRLVNQKNCTRRWRPMVSSHRLKELPQQKNAKTKYPSDVVIGDESIF